MSEEVTNYYDEYEKRQFKRGTHKRHFLIFEWLKSHGLRKNDEVLEVGSGIGTVTGLIADYLSQGSILATDISPKSIETARSILSKFSNVSFYVGEITEYSNEKKYNVIVLPDVLEHIPYENQDKLFFKLDHLLKEDGFILIHTPNPFYTEWLKINNPDILQIVDQPIHLSMVLEKLQKTNLCIDFVKAYSIWTFEPDYQIIVLKKRSRFNQFTSKSQVKQTLLDRLVFKVFRTLGITYFKLPGIK